MDKGQAIQSFWASFGLPAYDSTTVPDDAQMPYITYSVATDSLDNVVNLSASVWYRSTSWADISQKAEEIAKSIIEMQPPTIKFDGGRLYIAKGTPFAQRMTDPSDDVIRRMYLNIQAEYFSAY